MATAHASPSPSSASGVSSGAPHLGPSCPAEDCTGRLIVNAPVQDGNWRSQWARCHLCACEARRHLDRNQLDDTAWTPWKLEQPCVRHGKHLDVTNDHELRRGQDADPADTTWGFSIP